VIAQGYQMCNTVPTGVAIVPQTLPGGGANPHAGRIYVSWIAADPTSPLLGCNVTMAQAFHTAWIAWSDNNGSSWSDQGMTTAGTDLFPTIAAGDPGKVDVGWLNTNEIVPTDSLGKFLPGGCAGPGGLNPSFYPPTCHWQLHEGQSLDLNLGSAASTWTTS